MMKASSSTSCAPSSVLSMPLRYLSVATVALPLSAFVTCILITCWRNFESSTYTHCEVPEFAPSISASIGGFIPQKYIWQTCISIHTAPRFLFALLGTRHTASRISPPSKLPAVALLLQWAEILALLGLSIVSSSENFPIHKTCFITFVVCSWIFMSLDVYTLTRSSYTTRNQYERKAVQLKKRLLKITLTAVALMSYFYWRHNEYCEPYVYSFFCVIEYVVVVVNMCYHLAGGYYNFYASDLVATETVLSTGAAYLPLMGGVREA